MEKMDPLAIKHPLSIVSITYLYHKMSKRTSLKDLGGLTVGIFVAFLKEYIKSVKAGLIFPKLWYLIAVQRDFNE